MDQQTISAGARQAGEVMGMSQAVPSPARINALTVDQRMGLFEVEALPHREDLFRTAVRLVGDRGKAEDVIQEVYLQAWKSFDRYEPGTNCRAWLFKILFHSVNHFRRKWFRFSWLKESEEILETTIAFTPSIPEHLTDEEVLGIMDGIPEDYRVVVLLADIEEFAYKEIAGILKIPIGTVMSRLSRGRKLLRDRLSRFASSYGYSNLNEKGQGA